MEMVIVDGLVMLVFIGCLLLFSGMVVLVWLLLYVWLGEGCILCYLFCDDWVELLDECDGWVKVCYYNLIWGDVLGWVNVML